MPTADQLYRRKLIDILKGYGYDGNKLDRLKLQKIEDLIAQERIKEPAEDSDAKYTADYEKAVKLSQQAFMRQQIDEMKRKETEERKYDSPFIDVPKSESSQATTAKISQDPAKEQEAKNVNPSSEDLLKEMKDLEKLKKGYIGKILGWKYDVDCASFVIKRDLGRCMHYYDMDSIMMLPKSDLHQLSELPLVNPGSFPPGYEVEEYLKKQSKSNFPDHKAKPTRKRSTIQFALPNYVPPSKRPKLIKEKIVSWKYDSYSSQIIITRQDGSEDEIYEASQLRRLSTQDLLTLSNLTLKKYDANNDDCVFLMKAFAEAVTTVKLIRERNQKELEKKKGVGSSH